MKKYLLIIVGIIIGTVGTSYAVYKLKAEQVSFDNSNTGLNSDNVQDILDELTTGILSYGDAESSDIKEGKTALVNGKKITGTASGSSIEIYRNLSYFATPQSIIKSGYILNDEYAIYDNGIKFLKSGTISIYIDFGRFSSDATFILDGYINGQISSSLEFYKTLSAYSSFQYQAVNININENDVLDFKFTPSDPLTNVISLTIFMN